MRVHGKAGMAAGRAEEEGGGLRVGGQCYHRRRASTEVAAPSNNEGIHRRPSALAVACLSLSRPARRHRRRGSRAAPAQAEAARNVSCCTPAGPLRSPRARRPRNPTRLNRHIAAIEGSATCMRVGVRVAGSGRARGLCLC
eukprot:364764-Chlamydomonas_euryale.AAC.6